MNIPTILRDILKYWPLFVSVAVLLWAFLHWQNTGVRLTNYSYYGKKLPKGFDGFKIVQISDYHNTSTLEKKILELTKQGKPDIIAITGDLMDCRRPNVTIALRLAQGLCNIAPVYFVSGNHEARIDTVTDLYKGLRALGINVLEEKKQMLERNGDLITIMGVSDPYFYTKHVKDDVTRKAFRKHMLTVNVGDGSFKLLLSHRPEFIDTYHDSDIDLALTGHAHGGQFGIPFTDIGVLVPNQGLFPPYAAGVKKLGDTTEIISRGLGNSLFPFRLFNRPEMVMITLKAGQNNE